MLSVIDKLTRHITSVIKTPIINSVRYRYHADKLEEGALVRRYGFVEKHFKEGKLGSIDISSKPCIQKFKIPPYA